MTIEIEAGASHNQCSMKRVESTTSLLYALAEEPGDSESSIVSILCPTLFNAPRFPKLFQRSGRAIRAGVIVAKLLSKLHFVPCCSQFGYRTLNQ